jgi:signal peptidase I
MLCANKENGKSKFSKKKKIKRIMSKFASIIVWTLGFCLLYLCLSNLYQQLFSPTKHTGFFGVGEAVVVSDSMQPQLYPNDLIFYKEVPSEEIIVGDVVVYERTNSNGNKILIVHRVEKIENGHVTTKGINNSVSDEPFPIAKVIGKYMFKIGKIGVLLSLLSTSWAPWIILAFLAFVSAMRIVAYYLNKKKSIAMISSDEETKSAIDHFFDI